MRKRPRPAKSRAGSVPVWQRSSVIPTGWASRQMRSGPVDPDTSGVARSALSHGIAVSGSSGGRQTIVEPRFLGISVREMVQRCPATVRHAGCSLLQFSMDSLGTPFVLRTRFSGTPPLESAVFRHLAGGRPDGGTAPVAGSPRRAMPGSPMWPRCGQAGGAGGDPHRSDRPRTPDGGRRRQACRWREGASDSFGE